MRTILPAVFLVFGILFLLYSPVPVKAEISGEALFKTHCIPCHGEDGKGTDLGKGLGTPDFTDANWQKTKTDERFVEQILNGTPDKMFAFKDKLNMDEVKALVAYVRHFAK